MGAYYIEVIKLHKNDQIAHSEGVVCHVLIIAQLGHIRHSGTTVTLALCHVQGIVFYNMIQQHFQRSQRHLLVPRILCSV